MKIKVITDSEELEQFTSREDITISKVDIKPCDQNFFAQEWFVAVVMYEENTSNNTYWQSFHNQAAKDILCALLTHYGEALNETVKDSLLYADVLISKLKEKEKK